MIVGCLLIAVVTAGNDGAADVVMLRDGQIVLGQVVDGSSRGRVTLVVRRAWAEKALPARFKAWQAAEAPTLLKAIADRLHRLSAWQDDRKLEPAVASNPIDGGIKDEIERLEGTAGTPPLMQVSINKNEIRSTTRRPPEAARRLRQAWKAGFADAETRPLAELSRALEGRGFAMTDVDPAPIDTLLPVPPEPENRWLARRAATEVAHDKGLRYIAAQGMVLPEGTPANVGDATEMLGGLFKTALGGLDPGNPLLTEPMTKAFQDAAARGRVGLLLTRQETAEDLSASKAEVILYARSAQGQWQPVAARSATVRAGDPRPGDGAGLADDPQIKTVFQSLEGLGLTVPADLKQKSLQIGAATQKAIADARTAIQPDLDALMLPLDRAR